MIYTLTLNPSIDYIAQVENLVIGKVNRSSYEKVIPGGKGINVSKVLKNMGKMSCALGFVGGFTGDFIEKTLKNEGIKTDFVHLEKGISRINLKIKDKKETEINAPGPEILEKEKALLIEKLKRIKDGDTLVLAGSVPLGFEKNFYELLIIELCSKNIKIVVDAEKELLMSTLKYGPFLIKPNNFEMEDIFERKLESVDEIKACAEELQKMGAKNVIVSMGAGGGVFVCQDGRAFYCPVPSGRLKNSTGAGDSVVGGFIAELEESGDFEKAFLKGLCCGSASAFSEDFATKEEVLILFDEVKGKIKLL